MPLNTTDSEALEYRAEAAIADILKNSGVQALAADGDILAVKEAIELQLFTLNP